MLISFQTSPNTWLTSQCQKYTNNPSELNAHQHETFFLYLNIIPHSAEDKSIEPSARSRRRFSRPINEEFWWASHPDNGAEPCPRTARWLRCCSRCRALAPRPPWAGGLAHTQPQYCPSVVKEKQPRSPRRPGAARRLATDRKKNNKGQVMMHAMVWSGQLQQEVTTGSRNSVTCWRSVSRSDSKFFSDRYLDSFVILFLVCCHLFTSVCLLPPGVAVVA